MPTAICLRHFPCRSVNYVTAFFTDIRKNFVVNSEVLSACGFQLTWKSNDWDSRADIVMVANCLFFYSWRFILWVSTICHLWYCGQRLECAWLTWPVLQVSAAIIDSPALESTSYTQLTLLTYWKYLADDFQRLHFAGGGENKSARHSISN